MKIGWDLDGCLAEVDNATLYMIRHDKNAKTFYYSTLKPQVHPEFFAGTDDEVYIITSRDESLKKVTEEWCKKWFPQYRLVIASTPPYQNVNEQSTWHWKAALKKANVINKLELDVYFEDTPKIVCWLRQFCPNTKIIQYGGQIRR